MPDALISALAGFVGVVAGAMLTRTLSDRAERTGHLRAAYVDWFLALIHLLVVRDLTGVPTDDREEAIALNALVRTRWMLRVIETERARLKTISRLTDDVINRRYSESLDAKIEAMADEVGQRFSKLGNWSFLAPDEPPTSY
jgi:hypothetical protein